MATKSTNLVNPNAEIVASSQCLMVNVAAARGLQSVLKTNINDKETTLSVDKLPSGVYFIELRIKNYTGIIKAIKL